MDQVHRSRVGEQKLVPTLAQVFPEFEAKALQGWLHSPVESLLEVAPGLALLVLLVTIVTSPTQLIGTFRISIGISEQN
jgi:hypothetical protein